MNARVRGHAQDLDIAREIMAVKHNNNHSNSNRLLMLAKSMNLKTD